VSTRPALDTHWDFIVIGAGPAGQKAAVQAAKVGKRVLVIDRADKPGGECVRRGTIPSKALREQAQQFLAFRQRNATIGLSGRVRDVQLSGHMRRASEVMAVHAATADRQLARNGVMRIRAQARFLDTHLLQVIEVGGRRTELSADTILIATGSRPRAPDGIPVDHEQIFDSDSIVELPYLPASLIVLGGGVIACEYASIFAALGAHVTLIDRAPRPLGFVDADLSDVFMNWLRKAGGTIYTNASIESVDADGLAEVAVRIQHQGAEKTIRAEKAFVALGRMACTDGLALDRAGVRISERGFVEVDEHLRAGPGVYAAGDVIGPPSLASTSMEQGRRAARHALGLPAVSGFEIVPVGIYTIPELASVGLSAAEARTKYGDVLVGRATSNEIARGIIKGATDGLLKIVADARAEKILGVQAAGDGAAELVHIGQMAMMGGLGPDDLVDHVFNFPTMAESFRVAALDLLGQRDRRARARSSAA
jgi:NAD(P) transhydrogenase